MDTSDIEMMFRRKVEENKQFHENCKKNVQNQNQTPKAIRVVPKGLMNEKALDQLMSLGSNIAERQKHVDEQERDWQQSMQNMKREIAQLEGECNNVENSLEEKKQLYSKKEFAAQEKAKDKYSSALGVKIHTKDLDDEHYVAAVKFSTEEAGKTISLTVNRSTRRVTAFDASQLMSPEQAAELQRAVTDQQGQIDMRKLIAKVRPMCIAKSS